MPEFKARMLQPLTLDAVKAKSLAQDMRLRDKSHSELSTSTMQRLATLGETVGACFNHGALVSDPVRLQDQLLELAAFALTWAELLDIVPCRCPDIGVVCWRHIELREGGVLQ